MLGLAIHNLHISAADKSIVEGVSLVVRPGEVHAIMGPNGSGKSTLANALMGHPKYTITAGTITVDDTDATVLPPHERARLGLFLSQQTAPEIAGVSIANMLRLAVEAQTGTKKNPIEFYRELTAKAKELSFDTDWLKRSINVGFSGGEKKRLEVFQLLVLNPRFAILDETDSGLDVDALKIVAGGINRFRSAEHGVLMITHYNRILEYVQPDFVHIMVQGKIVASGGQELAEQVEKEGYAKWL